MVLASRSDLHTELQERLRFETLVADISARFVNIPADQVDTRNRRCATQNLRVS